MPDDRDDRDDDRPRSRRRRDDDESAEDWDDRPRRRMRDEDDSDDDRPRRRRRQVTDPLDDPSLAGVLPVNTPPLAIAAGYLGLFAVLVLPAPVALILGILALRQLRRNPKLRGHSRAIFAIVMGGLFTLLPLALFAYGAVKDLGK